MLDSINTPKTRALLYALIVVSSLTVFGNVAELCDIANLCSARLGAIIGLGVAATIISGLGFIGLVLQIRPLESIELGLSILLVIIFSVCAGIASSFRTKIQETIAVSFSWVGLSLSCVVAFMALTVEGGILRHMSTREKKISRRRRDVETGEQVPEDQYMKSVGDKKTGNDAEKGGESTEEKPMQAEEEKKGWLG